MDLQLKDKLALVTGSTAGIGLAIAASLAAEGTRVIVNGRDEKRVNGALEEIRRAQPGQSGRTGRGPGPTPGRRGDDKAFSRGGHPGQQPGNV